MYRSNARAALAAAKYEDGIDEAAAIKVGVRCHLDPVSVIEAFDGMIEEALR